MIQAAGSAQWTIFAKVANVDVWELSLRVADEVAHHSVVVEANEDDLCESRDTSECCKGMPHHGLQSQSRTEIAVYLSSNRQQGFWACLISFFDMKLLQSSDRGLMRVPFDGPPTRITPFVTEAMLMIVDVNVQL